MDKSLVGPQCIVWCCNSTVRSLSQIGFAASRSTRENAFAAIPQKYHKTCWSLLPSLSDISGQRINFTWMFGSSCFISVNFFFCRCKRGQYIQAHGKNTSDNICGEFCEGRRIVSCGFLTFCSPALRSFVVRSLRTKLWRRWGATCHKSILVCGWQ